jgi:hypothetical protein
MEVTDNLGPNLQPLEYEYCDQSTEPVQLIRVR